MAPIELFGVDQWDIFPGQDSMSLRQRSGVPVQLVPKIQKLLQEL